STISPIDSLNLCHRPRSVRPASPATARHHTSSPPPRPSGAGRLAILLDLGEILLTQLGHLLRAIIATQRGERLAHALHALLHRLHVIEQLPDGSRDRIRHVLTDPIGIETDLLGDRLALGLLRIIGLDDDLARDAHRGRPRRNRTSHDGVRADLGAGTDSERPENLRASTDNHAILERRMALALAPAGATQGNAVIKRHVVADLRRLTDNDTHAMIDEKTPADLRAGMNLDAGEPAPQIGIHPRQPLVVTLPEPMRQPVEPDRMQPRIASHHFEGVARRGIAVEYALDIFAHAFEHQSCLRL